MTRFTWIVLVVLSGPCVRCVAADLLAPQIEDLYRTDVAVGALTINDEKSAIYVRQRVDPQTRALKQSLWRVDAGSEPRAVETGEPDASSPMLSPDGKWIVFLSTRPFEDGTPAVVPVPPYSDPAMDIWFLPVDGGRAIPLGGKGKPYGRVITDSFYGRVSFSPDGKRLLFVADDGQDRRTEQERRNNVIVVREDQGEGYEGYGPTQVWVADLQDEPNEKAAGQITRLTPDDYWYGDPQWSPDGSFIVVHANRNRSRNRSGTASITTTTCGRSGLATGRWSRLPPDLARSSVRGSPPTGGPRVPEFTSKGTASGRLQPSGRRTHFQRTQLSADVRFPCYARRSAAPSVA